MSRRLSVLIVEDSEDDALLVLRQLKAGGFDVVSERVEDAEAMRRALATLEWEAVISDYSLPRFSAPEALEVLAQSGLDLPFVVVSGAIGENRAVEAMRAGAHDYVMKDNLARLAPAIDRELREASERKERRRAERDLREAESLARLGSMAAVVAHEVRNPLAGIKGAIEIIGDRLPEGGRDRQIVAEILERIDSLNRTIEDLLLFARPRQPQRLGVPVRALLAGALQLLESDPAFSRVDVEVTGEDLELVIDAELVKEVIFNLLINAAHAMEGAGSIRVSVRVAGHICELAVEDDGPGIRDEIRSRIFEPFFTTRTRGTGLGLAIARQVMRAHGGRIGFECPAAGGTRFVLEFPLDGAPRRERTRDVERRY